jgi:hypothetical protein
VKTETLSHTLETAYRIRETLTDLDALDYFGRELDDLAKMIEAGSPDAEGLAGALASLIDELAAEAASTATATYGVRITKQLDGAAGVNPVAYYEGIRARGENMACHIAMAMYFRDNPAEYELLDAGYCYMPAPQIED